MSIPEADYDGAWKEALDLYLPECLALLAPDLAAAIDWSRGFVFLETELQSITGTAAIGVRAVDKLVQVWLRDGSDAWVLIHIEAQHQRDAGFPRRVFVYFTRLLDQYNRPVVSLAILGDADPTWRPSGWEAAWWGCGVRFWFPVVKLVDYRDRLAALAAERNPFATVVLAHLAAEATRRDPTERQRSKFAQVRRLYELGYGREEVLQLFRLIDWLIRLPEGLERAFWREVQTYEEERQMPYITSVERLGIEQGLQQGRLEGEAAGRRAGLLAGLMVALEVKFGAAGQVVAGELGEIADEAVLTAVGERLRTAMTVEEVRAVYQPPEA